MHRLPASTTSVFRNLSAPSRATIITAALNGEWRLFLAQRYLRTVVCGLDIYSGPVGMQNIVINLSVCVSASMSLEPLDRSARNLVCRSPVAMPQYSSGSFVLRYVGFMDDITFGCSGLYECAQT